MTPAHEVEKEDDMTSVAESGSALHGRATDGGVKLEGVADPFAMARSGGSPRTGTEPASRSIGVTIRRGSPALRQTSSSAPEAQSSCDQQLVMPFSSGETSSTTAAKRASAVRSSATKAPASRQSLSDRLTRSLITSGLVAGITPSSIRQLSGQPIRVLAFDTPAGGGAA